MLKILAGAVVVAFLAVSTPTQAGNLTYLPFLRRSPPPFLVRSGIASWYGSQFQGSQTASGEGFNMNALTAAHRTLPLGSRILVTNLKNHRALVLRVNDRGPYVPGRILDVSRAAARRLGFKGAGLARVRIQVLSLPPDSQDSPSCPKTGQCLLR